jgi:hypothetical protein
VFVEIAAQRTGADGERIEVEVFVHVLVVH